MAETFKNLEKEILEYCYSTIISLEDYYHNLTIEELKEDKRFNEINENEIFYWIDQLKKINFIEITTLPRTFYFRISLEGILFLESFYIKEEQIFISLTVDLLDFLKKVEDQSIELYSGEGNQVGSFPISEFLDIIGRTDEKEQRMLTFIINEFTRFQKGENYVYFNSFGLAGNNLVFYRTVLLTAKGREFLSYHQKFKKLFPTLHDKFAKEVILEEYNEIEHLRKREKWKDAFIKMGSILEFLITNYIEENNLDKDENGIPKRVEILIGGRRRSINPIEAKFGEKLSFIIQNEIFGIEYNTDWNIVDGLIRKLRNYIHLHQYIKDKSRITKDLFDKFYNVFERLILLF